MNLNRLRPTGVAKEDLDDWLSGVIHDACRDAIEAGMPERDVHQLLETIARMHHPMGSMAPAREWWSELPVTVLDANAGQYVLTADMRFDAKALEEFTKAGGRIVNSGFRMRIEPTK